MTEEKKEIPLHRERLGLPDRVDQQKLNAAKQKQLRRDMAFCFTTNEGRRVLRYLMNLAGYKKPKVGGNTQIGMDVLVGTVYNTAREGLLLEFIEHIPVDILRDCEFGTFSELEE